MMKVEDCRSRPGRTTTRRAKSGKAPNARVAGVDQREAPVDGVVG
jgi:hypothetical protein